MKLPPRLTGDFPQLRPLTRLRTGRAIQDFLDTIPINMERRRETCSSPAVSLRRGSAHCLEGSLVAALALWMHGHPPLLMDLKTTEDDVDHIVTLFRKGGFWGGITK